MGEWDKLYSCIYGTFYVNQNEMNARKYEVLENDCH